MFSALFVSAIVWHFALLDLHHTKILIPNHISKVCSGYLLTSRCKNNTRVYHFLLQGEGFLEKVKIFYGICGPHDNKKGHCTQYFDKLSNHVHTLMFTYYLFFSCSFNAIPFAVWRYFWFLLCLLLGNVNSI